MIQGSPLLQQLLVQVAPLVPEVKPLIDHAKSGLQLPGQRSGCPPFLHATGTPCLSLLFTNHSVRITAGNFNNHSFNILLFSPTDTFIQYKTWQCSSVVFVGDFFTTL